MAQNISFFHAIEREAMKARANAHPHKSLPGWTIALKTTHTFLGTSWELYWTILKPIYGRWNFWCLNISKFFVRFVTTIIGARL